MSGSSIERQTNAIHSVESAIGKMANGMSASTGSMVMSMDRVHDGVQTVTRQMSGFESALGALAANIDEGFAELSYQMRLQSGLLSQILEVLQAPLDTQSKELRKRAQDAYQSGWIDDAEEDFLKSRELNRYDFTIHQALGNIAFFHRKHPQEAATHFTQASKYARPKSSFDCALAELSLASVADYSGINVDALSHATAALDVAPKLPEANYAVARYSVKEGILDQQIGKLLLNAFRGRLALCMLAVSDEALQPAKEHIEKALDDYHKELKDEIGGILVNFEHAIDIADSVTTQPSSTSVSAVVDDGESQVSAMKSLIITATIIDLHSAINPLKADIQAFIRKANSAIAQARSAVVNANYQRNQTKETVGTFAGVTLGVIFAIIGFPLGLSAGVAGFIASAKNPGILMILMFFLMLASPFIGAGIGFAVGLGFGGAVGLPTSSSAVLEAYDAATRELNLMLNKPI